MNDGCIAGSQKNRHMSELPSSSPPIIVVGGGWAGLAAAVELCRRRQPVLLLESARQLGGRARSVRIGDTVVDNGQHLMIGAYRRLLTLMHCVGVDPEQCFKRLPLTLCVRRGAKPSLTLRTPRLPAPFHLLAGVVTARGLSAGEKLRAMRFGRRVLKQSLTPARDISVQALLHSEAQSPGLIHKLWGPLCIAALNTPIDIASARLFIQVLKSTFGEINRHSDLLIPATELNNILPGPAADFIERHGGRIELGQRVTALETDNGKLTAVKAGERRIEAERVILATPHVITRRLLAHHHATAGIAAALAELGHEPITTLYLQYPAETRLPLVMMAFEDTLAQWIFDRRVCGQAGMMAVVISARGQHRDMPVDALTARVVAELATGFPHWPAPESTQVVREKRATFCARVGIDIQRPANTTAQAGLWLAGDYTATDLPATLESAVTSGIACANAVLEQPHR